MNRCFPLPHQTAGTSRRIALERVKSFRFGFSRLHAGRGFFCFSAGCFRCMSVNKATIPHHLSRFGYKQDANPLGTVREIHVPLQRLHAVCREVCRRVGQKAERRMDAQKRSGRVVDPPRSAIAMVIISAAPLSTRREPMSAGGAHRPSPAGRGEAAARPAGPER